MQLVAAYRMVNSLLINLSMRFSLLYFQNNILKCYKQEIRNWEAVNKLKCNLEFCQLAPTFVRDWKTVFTTISKFVALAYPAVKCYSIKNTVTIIWTSYDP